MQALLGAGVDVIIDDRPDRVGVKFSDAELVGIPFRITIGKRGLATGTAELTDRATGETVSVPLDDLAKHVREAVAEALSAVIPAGSTFVFGGGPACSVPLMRVVCAFGRFYRGQMRKRPGKAGR
jgi:hypothetical protein